MYIYSYPDTFSFTDVNLVFEPYGDETAEIKEHIKKSYDENYQHDITVPCSENRQFSR